MDCGRPFDSSQDRFTPGQHFAGTEGITDVVVRPLVRTLMAAERSQMTTWMDEMKEQRNQLRLAEEATGLQKLLWTHHNGEPPANPNSYPESIDPLPGDRSSLAPPSLSLWSTVPGVKPRAYLWQNSASPTSEAGPG